MRYKQKEAFSWVSWESLREEDERGQERNRAFENVCVCVCVCVCVSGSVAEGRVVARRQGR